MQLGDKLSTTVENNGDVYTFNTTRRSGESDSAFIARHFDEIRDFLRENQ